MFVAKWLSTALAERFKTTREIRVDQPAVPIVYAWTPQRALHLLDVRGDGALAVGASHVVNTGPKSVTRAWARGLRAAWPQADGVAYSSSMSGGSCIALWAPAADSFPTLPEFAKLLSDPSARWVATLRQAAVQIAFTFST